MKTVTKPLGKHLYIVFLFLAALPNAAEACSDHMTLAEATNKAARLVGEGSPRVAITKCYEKFFDLPAFGQATPDTQERFLYEYVEAALTAAAPLPDSLAPPYYAQAVLAALKYIDSHWEQMRHSRVILNLGVGYQKLNRGDELLSAYEDISSQNPELFDAACAEFWEKILRMYPDYQRDRDDLEIRRQLRTDPTYRASWEAFRAFLQAFKDVPRMRGIAMRKLAMIRGLFGE